MVLILVGLMILIATISIQNFILSEFKVIWTKIVGLFLNGLGMSLGFIILSFVVAENSDETDGGLSELFDGFMSTIIGLPLMYGVLLISLVIQIILMVRKSKKKEMTDKG